MHQKITYTKLTAKIILTTLMFTLIAAFIYGEVMKDKAIHDLSRVDAKKTSMLIFESLYAAMEKGWTRNDLKRVITRLDSIDPNMKVNVYRSSLVSQLYGEIKEDKKKRESNYNLKKAMRGEEVLQVLDDSTIRFYYPIIAKEDCISCHSNALQGNILGAIYISYPVNDLKVSLNTMINFFILFIIFFSLVIFFALFIEFDKYLVKPIKKFVTNINTISSNNDLSQRVDTYDDIEEIHSMQSVFNHMLDSIEYQFYNDTLTGLHNRKKLIDELDKKLNSTLFLINIDGFQEINNLYGNIIGDTVLKDYAKFLNKMTHDNCCTLYRLHSDEFAILCTQHFDLDEINKFATYITESTAKKEFKIDKKTNISISSTIGVSFGKNLLLTNADIALKLAKAKKENYLIYNSSMNAEHEYAQNLNWTKKIKEAINNDKIVPLFQPIVCVETQKIVKYEALMRMVDKNGEYIPPIHFLELAKKNKLYHQLTKIIINKTFDKFETNANAVSINLSVYDIVNEDIINLIIDKLEKTQIGNRVIFEIIESDGIENFDQVIEFIDRVKAYGCKIAIDDFGTGYSNFEYLMKLKVDFIKIDASMIKNIDTDENSLMVTQTIIDFAKKMNIKTIAEFVHSKSVFDKISTIEIDFAQGYYFGEAKELES